jgi:hypothetical protein
METILTSSGLTVCYQGADYSTVSRALRQLDPALLLDKELDEWGRERWLVRVRVGDDPRGWPAPVVWVEPDGTPRDLSLGIVDQVRAQEVRRKADVMDGRRLAASAGRVRDRLAEEARQDRDDLIREHYHRLSPAHGKPVTFERTLRED